MNLLSIDPGAKTLAYAAWRDGVLEEADLLQPGLGMSNVEAWRKLPRELEDRGFYLKLYTLSVIVEVPQIYVMSRSKGNPSGLLDVMGMVGGLASVFERIELVKPREWKGQVPKDVTKARVLATLTEEEKEEIPDLPKSLIHNVYDAIGIGLFKLGRRAK